MTADPAGAARGVVNGWARRFERRLIHVDVDVLDFLDFPIAEETAPAPSSRPRCESSSRHRMVALTICEINPDHDPDGSSMRTLSEAIADVLAGAAVQ